MIDWFSTKHPTPYHHDGEELDSHNLQDISPQQMTFFGSVIEFVEMSQQSKVESVQRCGDIAEKFHIFQRPYHSYRQYCTDSFLSTMLRKKCHAFMPGKQKEVCSSWRNSLHMKRRVSLQAKSRGQRNDLMSFTYNQRRKSEAGVAGQFILLAMGFNGLVIYLASS